MTKKNIGRRQFRRGPPKVRWDPSGATRRKKTMISVGRFGTATVDAVVLASDFGPARRLNDVWACILTFGLLGDTQIAAIVSLERSPTTPF